MHRALVYLLAVAGLAGPAAAQAGHSIAEQYLYQAANAERAERGLPQLRWDETLYRAALGHCREMAGRESISHQYAGEPDLSARAKAAGVRFSFVAENVAEANTSVRIHQAWMDSPGHRENLLDARSDSIAIAVLSRNGQLYAVQDFDRSFATLSFSDQENTVASLLASVAPVDVAADPGDARRTCDMETGYAGARRPWFVMRYTTVDLNNVPDELMAKLASGKFHEVAVGACPLHGQYFSAYNFAVLLYP